MTESVAVAFASKGEDLPELLAEGCGMYACIVLGVWARLPVGRVAAQDGWLAKVHLVVKSCACAPFHLQPSPNPHPETVSTCEPAYSTPYGRTPFAYLTRVLKQSKSVLIS